MCISDSSNLLYEFPWEWDESILKTFWSLFIIANAKILQIVRTIDADYWMKIIENFLVSLKLFAIYTIVR